MTDATPAVPGLSAEHEPKEWPAKVEYIRALVLLIPGASDEPALMDNILDNLAEILGPLPGDAALSSSSAAPAQRSVCGAVTPYGRYPSGCERPPIKDGLCGPHLAGRRRSERFERAAPAEESEVR